MEYVHWEKNKIYIGFLVLGMIGAGMVIGVPPAAKGANKSASLSFRIPPLPTPPEPLPIDSTSRQQEDVLIGVSTASLLASVALFIESQSIELLVEQLRGITPQAAYDFIAELIKRPRAMDADEVIQVAYGLLVSFMRDKEQRDQTYRILDLLHTSPQLQERPPLLVIAAHSSYPHVISLIVHWAKSRLILDTCIKDALVVIARTFDIPMFKRLEQYGVTITPERATYVLWHAVQVSPGVHFADNDERIAQAEAKRAFIDFLITKKANVNYHQDGYTMLMQATKHNDVATIEQLSRNGADVNRIVNDAVGSALQIAIINDFIDAELVLRQHHALE